MADAGKDAAQYGEAVDDYLSRAYGAERRREVLTAGGWDPDLVAALAGLGWNALAVPESLDGIGAPLSELGPVFVQLGRHLVAGPMLENMLVPALLESRHWDVPAVAAAVETGIPIALVDPGVTVQWTDAVGAVELRGAELFGTVHAVRFAAQAGVLAVVAESDDGQALCLVDPKAPGVTITELESADPATTFGRVELSGAPARDLAEVDPVDGETIARIRAWARLLIACELSGLAQHCLEQTIEYLGKREQFGRTIGSFQAVKHLAADMHTRWAGMRSLCLAALADADDASLDELELLAATAKSHASKTAVLICQDAIQLHGGIGFTTDSDVSWYYKRALALRPWYGDEVELDLQVGSALLDRDLDVDPGHTTDNTTDHAADAASHRARSES